MIKTAISLAPDSWRCFLIEPAVAAPRRHAVTEQWYRARRKGERVD